MERALELVEAGADMIDIGGQSGIAGVPEIDPAYEIHRVLPVSRVCERYPTWSSRQAELRRG